MVLWRLDTAYVFPLEPQQDEEEDAAIASTREGGAVPRISVAINLEAEVPEKPILEWELRSTAGTAAAQVVAPSQ